MAGSKAPVGPARIWFRVENSGLSESGFFAPKAGGPLTFTVDGVLGSYLTISFRRQRDADDLAYHVQFSPNLTTWNEDGVLAGSTPNADGTVTETWRSGAPVSGNARAFARLSVTQQESLAVSIEGSKAFW